MTQAELVAHYEHQADATGHSKECRRRIPPQMGSDHRALDGTRCDRCAVLSSHPGWEFGMRP